MSVEAIRLKNFMAFQDTDWIELRPLTLLFGKNSSGKSVIGRALRLLKQSLAAEPGSGPFVYATRQGVDVGDFGTMIHVSPSSPDRPKPVVFAFRCRLADTLDTLINLVNQQRRREGLAPIPASQAQDQVEVWLQYERNNELEQAWLTELEIVYPQGRPEQQPGLVIFAAYRLDYRVVTEGQDEWWFRSDILHGHEVDKEPAWAGLSIEMVSGFLPALATPEIVRRSSAASIDDLRFVVALLRELRQTVEQFLQRTDYLGPLRPEPEREFVFDAQRIRDWQDSGLQGYLRYLRGEVDQSVIDKVNNWLQGVDLCHRARPTTFHSFGERALFAQVDIYEEDKRESRNLADVGFGLSQALPVIIQCLVADSDSTLLIEQPELHLHPEAQAMLADLLIDCVNRRKARLIIETHSEHLLLRLQRRIAETTLDDKVGTATPRNQGHTLRPDELWLVLVNRMDGRSQTEGIQADHRGQLVNPSTEFQDFFKYDYDDVISLTRATSDIMALESQNDRSH